MSQVPHGNADVIVATGKLIGVGGAGLTVSQLELWNQYVQLGLGIATLIFIIMQAGLLIPKWYVMLKNCRCFNRKE